MVSETRCYMYMYVDDLSVVFINFNLLEMDHDLMSSYTNIRTPIPCPGDILMCCIPESA